MAMEQNDENLVVLEDPYVAAIYLREFISQEYVFRYGQDEGSRGLADDMAFVSARVPPERPNPDRSAVTMTDGELIEMIRRRGGTPPEVLAEPDLMARLLPSIRADFVLLDSYRYVPDAPLGCPITGFTGTRDPHATKLDLREWALHTTGPFSLLELEGGHFFINSGRDRVVRSVDQAIRDSSRAGGHPRAPANPAAGRSGAV